MSAAADPGHDADEPDLVEETRRMASAVQGWLRSTTDSTAEPPATHTGSDCDWCPICQFAAALRAEHPELAARIGEAATAMSAALRAILDTALTVDLRSPDPAKPRRRPRPYPREAEASDPGVSDPRATDPEAER